MISTNRTGPISCRHGLSFCTRCLKPQQKSVHSCPIVPRPAINDLLWAEMTPAQRSEAVRSGYATLRQMVEGLLDGSDELQLVCREFLARTDASLNELNCESAQLSRLDKQPL